MIDLASSFVVSFCCPHTPVPKIIKPSNTPRKRIYLRTLCNSILEQLHATIRSANARLAFVEHYSLKRQRRDRTRFPDGLETEIQKDAVLVDRICTVHNDPQQPGFIRICHKRKPPARSFCHINRIGQGLCDARIVSQVEFVRGDLFTNGPRNANRNDKFRTWLSRDLWKLNAYSSRWPVADRRLSSLRLARAGICPVT